jgi:hypothetical protein
MLTSTKKHSMYLTVVILFFALFVTGCSSKPEVEDISKDILKNFQCSAFTISGFKKTDGVPVSDKQYKVSFTFDAELKGGKSGAAAMLSNVLKYDDSIKIAVNQKNRKPFGEREADEKKIADLEQKWLDARGYECESALLIEFSERTKAKLKIESGPIAVPYLAKIKGVGSMTKAESGWIFTSGPDLNISEIVETAPAAFNRPTQVQANGPSFNCADPANKNDEIICSNANLSKLDLDVANSFKSYLSRATDKDYAKAEHAEWKIKIRNSCTTLECLIETYTLRLDQLK